MVSQQGDDKSRLAVHTVFQTPSWVRLLADLSGAYGWRAVDLIREGRFAVPWYLVERRWKGVFRSLDAMPFGLYGPPFANSDNASIELDLPLGLLKGRTVSLTYVEHPLLPKVAIRPSPGVVPCSQTVSTEILLLPSTEEEMWAGISQYHRKKIRRARKASVTIRPGSQEGDTDKFYQLYAPATKSWGYAEPPYPKSFFEKVLGQSDKLGIRLALAERERVAIAALITIDDFPAPLAWFGVQDNQSTQYYPYYLLVWEEICRAISKGHKWFNFGSSGDLEGVRHFKLVWGAKTTPYQIHTLRKEPLCTWIERLVQPAAKVRQAATYLMRYVVSRVHN